MRYYEYMREEGRRMDNPSKIKVGDTPNKTFPNVGFIKDEDVTWGREQDNVNHPSHYGNGEIECIDYIQDFLNGDEFQGYLRGNIAKYLHRWPYKNGVEDLKKAQWYLNKLIEVTEE